MPRTPKTKISSLLFTISILTSGCDDRATQIAREAADRQAEQNRSMATLQQEVAQGSRELVTHDAAARQDFVGVHRDLAAERARLDTGWQALETERAQIARQRRTESLLVPAIQVAGGLALVVVLLGFSWYALVRLRAADSADAQLNVLLVEELLAGDGQDTFSGASRPAIGDSADSRPRLQ